MSPLSRIVIALMVWLILTSATTPSTAHAQKDPVKDPKTKEPEPSDLDFWIESQRLQAGSAAQVILARHPITAFVLRAEGKRWSVWREPEFLAETAPPLSQDLFDDIRDRTPRPVINPKSTKDQLAYHDLWIQAIRQAFQTPPEAFTKSAQENEHVTFTHLVNNPKKYRGKVVTVEGRLAQLKKIDLTQQELINENIVDVYEGYVFDATDVSRQRPPYIVFLTKIPDELARILKLPQSRKGETLNQWVTVHGYFLKVEVYKAKYSVENTPVLAAPTLILKPRPKTDDDDSPISQQFIYAVVGFSVFMIVLLTTLSWWFRRGDRQFRDRLADLHAKSAAAAVEAAEQGLPLAPDLPSEENLKMGSPPPNVLDVPPAQDDGGRNPDPDRRE